MASFKALQKYNIKRSLRKVTLTGTAAALLFAGCEKDPVQPDKPQPKIARLVFDKSGHHIELDTIRYYLAQGYDSIYMIPNDPNMFAEAHNIHNATLFLQDRCKESDRVNGGWSTLNVHEMTDINDREALRKMRFNVNVNPGR